jgi:predicted nucleotidyltransferase
MRFVGGAARSGRDIDIAEFSLQMEDICREHGLSLAYLFGSYARGNAGALSDIDVAILGDTALDWRDVTSISQRLSELLEDDAIDLVDLRRVPDLLAHRVLKEGVCLFARSLSARLDYEVGIEMRYADAAPLRKEYLTMLERRIVSGTFGR